MSERKPNHRVDYEPVGVSHWLCIGELKEKVRNGSTSRMVPIEFVLTDRKRNHPKTYHSLLTGDSHGVEGRRPVQNVRAACSDGKAAA